MRIVIAPDSFGGTLTAHQAADAIAAGWRAVRGDDELICVAMADGGEGLLDVVVLPDDTRLTVEAADPLGHPRDAVLLLRPDGTAIVESAEACGLALVTAERRDPLQATTYGVGQLLDAARDTGVRHIVVGLGGSASVDGGVGALTALGFHLTDEIGGGLKVGGGELPRVRRATRRWVSDAWRDVDIELLADVDTPLRDAARVFAPQKGAAADAVAVLEAGLTAWADVAERDLAGPGLREEPGSGAAGGLAFGLAAGLGARLRPGAAAVADLVDLDDALEHADVVVTGEGRLDATTSAGKVVAEVARRATDRGVRTLVVAGRIDETPGGVADHEAAAPDGPGDDPESEVRAAARRLAARVA